MFFTQAETSRNGGENSGTAKSKRGVSNSMRRKEIKPKVMFCSWLHCSAILVFLLKNRASLEFYPKKTLNHTNTVAHSLWTCPLPVWTFYMLSEVFATVRQNVKILLKVLFSRCPVQSSSSTQHHSFYSYEKRCFRVCFFWTQLWKTSSQRWSLIVSATRRLSTFFADVIRTWCLKS